jgi:prepilin-type N-terminal cleavage/methylation domain-containing protein
MRKSLVVCGRWPVASGSNPQSLIPNPCPPISKSLNPQIPKSPNPFPSGFTLIELLVTIAIIGILASMALGVMQAARQSAAKAATTATITKLNNIIMRRYESYLTRRVPLDLSKDTSGNRMSPKQMAEDRLYAIRDIMRMEMPDRSEDINSDPIQLPNSHNKVARPALSSLYYSRLNATPPTTGSGEAAGGAELLYLIVSLGSPEAMGQFGPSEIGDTNGNGWPEFLDGWGRPIFFLRWAPGYTPYSDVQKWDPEPSSTVTQSRYHDPFDPRRADLPAFQLIPLIYSGGPNSEPGLQVKDGFDFAKTGGTRQGDIFGNRWDEFRHIGEPAWYCVDHPKDKKSDPGVCSTCGKKLVSVSGGNITNHHIETR